MRHSAGDTEQPLAQIGIAMIDRVGVYFDQQFPSAGHRGLHVFILNGIEQFLRVIMEKLFLYGLIQDMV